jgi:glycosyltransferase involved in cell wall biosynthesis
MRLSLVVATVNRTTELERFLKHLRLQNCPDVELIIVDQNRDARLQPLVEEYGRNFRTIHLKSELGLSRARNLGLEYVTGDVVTFPDDDCWYPDGLFQRVTAFLDAYPACDGLCGRSADETGVSPPGRWRAKPAVVSVANVWSTITSYTFFFRLPVVRGVGAFDVALGLGADSPFTSSEDMDYILRALKTGARLRYDPSLVVHHRRTPPDAMKAYRYGFGAGYVMRRSGFSPWLASYVSAQHLAGSILFLAAGRPARARYYWAGFIGRLKGFMAGAKPATPLAGQTTP